MGNNKCNCKQMKKVKKIVIELDDKLENTPVDWFDFNRVVRELENALDDAKDIVIEVKVEAANGTT